ncbi:MAG: SGNH/GDSL hydrolase family protein [Candidatus Brocadiia bacterium]
MTNTVDTVAALFNPFWASTTQDRESLFFFQRKEGEQAWAPLLFPPEKILSVRSANGAASFEEGKDFVLEKDSAALCLVAGSRIPFKTPGEVYPPAASNLPRHAAKRGDPATHLIFGEGRFFHDLQVDATYTHAAGLWRGYVPRFQGGNLPVALGKLKRKQPVMLCALGDSITAGGNASKEVGAEPFQPAYGELTALGLARAYGTKVTFRNFAVGGWTSEQGLAEIALVTAGPKPDLAIIAFGMNDACGGNMAKFAANIRGMKDAIRAAAPEAEFVLVAPMLPNAEWDAPEMDNFPLIRQALAGLCGKGAVLADVTAVWTGLLQRKAFLDLTGNGLNHPNDFGHRIYAQTILALLVPPGAAAGTGEPKERTHATE